MPAFGRDGMLKRDDIVAAADYVRSLSGLSTTPGADLARGAKMFADNCAVCHGPDGKGNRALGAPNLTDQDLALRLGHEHHHRRHLERPRRRHAGLGRQARPRHDQGARRFTSTRSAAGRSDGCAPAVSSAFAVANRPRCSRGTSGARDLVEDAGCAASIADRTSAAR